MPSELKTSPEPARPPQVVPRLLRSKRVPALSTSVDWREPALMMPVLTPPAATVKSLPKKLWALNWSTPSPVLVMPPAEPTMACKASVARSGSTSAKPPPETGATSMTFGEAPKSTRPSMTESVVTLEEVATMPPEPMVSTPRLPAPVAELVAKVRRMPLALEPTLLMVSLATELSPK